MEISPELKDPISLERQLKVRQYIFQREMDSSHVFDINPWFDWKLINEEFWESRQTLASSLATSLSREV